MPGLARAKRVARNMVCVCACAKYASQGGLTIISTAYISRVHLKHDK